MTDVEVWVAVDEIYPAYEIRRTEAPHLPKYRLPVDLVEEYVRLRARLEAIGEELESHADRTGQKQPGQDSLLRHE